MRVLTVVVFVLAGTSAAVCQAEEPPKSVRPASEAPQSSAASLATPDQPGEVNQPLPDHVVYLIYFRHIANLDQVAAEREAEGKDGRGWRSHEQRAAGLSEGEGDTLKRVAYDCIRAVAETDRQAQRALVAFHAKHPPGETLVLLPPPELAQFDENKIQIVNAHIDQLKSGLGKSAFNALDSYVSKAFRASIRQIRVPSPLPSTTLPGGDQ